MNVIVIYLRMYKNDLQLYSLVQSEDIDIDIDIVLRSDLPFGLNDNFIDNLGLHGGVSTINQWSNSSLTHSK